MHPEVFGRRQALTMLTSGVGFIVAVMWMLFSPAPYAVQSPGPTINTLGEYQDITLISIDGAETYPDTETQLRLTTVVAAGGPGYPVNVPQAIRGWWLPTSTVLPREAVYPPEVTQEQMDDNAQRQMSRSQHDAAIMALAELDIDVPVELFVAGTDPQSGAHSLLRPEDRIDALTAPGHGRVDIHVYPDLSGTLAATPPGTEITLHIVRDGEARDVSFETADDGYGGSVLGVFLTPEFDMPFSIDIEVERVGGPSAGTMFALGIVDLLTPDSIAGDHTVAGTGTINLNGRVGPIGGIKQKMFGALRDGADYFLAPGENCREVVEHTPEGLTVLRIDTLEDAVAAIDGIKTGELHDVATCEFDPAHT